MLGTPSGTVPFTTKFPNPVWSIWRDRPLSKRLIFYTQFLSIIVRGATTTLDQIPLKISASHILIQGLVNSAVTQTGFGLVDEYGPGVVHLVVDNPLLWAFEVLEQMPTEELACTVVSTIGSHPVYLDCLASYGPSGIFVATDERSGLAAIYAASKTIPSYHMTSGLTKTELKLVRLLLVGLETNAIAEYVHIRKETVNTHFSNVLNKLECKDRTQLVAKALGYSKV